MQAELIFTELKYLAQERSPEKRHDLLHKITDLFFAGIDMHSEAETSLFNEVIERVVDQISHDARIDVATNLATLPGFPLQVVRKLACNDDIEIARPVIRGALGLTDLDLIDIGRRASDQTAVDKLSLIVSEALAIKLAERGYQVSGEIPERIVKAARDAFARAVQDRDRDALVAERVIAQFGAGRITLEDALMEVIKSQQMLAVAALLSHHTKLDRNVLMKILSGGAPQTVLVLLRALDLRWTTVAAFMAFRAAKQRTRPSPDVNTRDYEAIDATAAKRTLRFLQIRAKAGAEASGEGNPVVA